MGYGISLYEANILIKAENIQKARETLLAYKSFNYPNTFHIRRDMSFSELMKEYRWPVTVDDEGNVVDIEFTGENQWNSEEVFAILATFIENDSYLEIYDEDGDYWRWGFKNGLMERITPKTTWDE